MTKTGYSCHNMRRKAKHGCREAISHYCAETGKQIDPMSCNRGCKFFETLVSVYRKKETIDVELL